MERRTFIKTCGLACAGGTALALLLEGCVTSTHFAEASYSGERIFIKKSEFIKSEKNNTPARKYVLIKTEKYNYPVCIYKINENEYSALLMECTHKGCELSVQGDFLICPCHGSEFSNQGIVQNPPAEQNLQSFKTSTDEENIYIQM